MHGSCPNGEVLGLIAQGKGRRPGLQPAPDQAQRGSATVLTESRGKARRVSDDLALRGPYPFVELWPSLAAGQGMDPALREYRIHPGWQIEESLPGRLPDTMAVGQGPGYRGQSEKSGKAF